MRYLILILLLSFSFSECSDLNALHNEEGGPNLSAIPLLRQASSSHNQSSLVLVSDCETSAATL